MTLWCNEGGTTHMWAYPDFDENKDKFRICMHCKKSQSKVWKWDSKDGEAEHDV